MIPALILTAGLATRLRPLSELRAKAALPVAGTPLVERIIRWLAAAGVTDLVLNLHHLPQTITGVVGDGSHLGVRIRCSWEDPILGSAGGPRRALPLLAGPTFLIVNGDTLTDLDVGALMGAHRQSDALITMAVIPNQQPEKYGGVILDERGVVVGFRHKGEAGPGYHFIGVQAAEERAFTSVPEGVPVESVAGLYRELLRTRPGAIRAFVSDAEFFDIGTPRDYLETSLAIAAREALAMPGNSVVWDNVRIETGARVDRCIVTDGVVVAAGAALSNVIVTPFATTPIA